MVAVKLEGRLGNQLFQYAFIYATAQKLGVKFYLDKSIEKFIPLKYFDLQTDFITPLDRSIFSIKGVKNLFSIHAKRAFYKTLSTIIFGNKTIVIDNKELVTQALTKLKDGYMYEGYFQSEMYFESSRQAIKEQFVVKENYITKFSEIAKAVISTKKSIVIHVRRGDYIGLNYTLPLSYYKQALAAVNTDDAICIFISDDTAFVEKEFKDITNKYVSNYSEIIDLQFLINADICILSNSSFSWWGAWLNSKPGKIIYAQKHWLQIEPGKDYPVDIGCNMNFNWI
jgi:hypothetical protein